MLRLEVAAVRLSANDLAYLAALTGLEELTIVLPPAPAPACWDDHSAAAIRTLSRVPTMKIIAFNWFQKQIPFPAQPSVDEFAAFSSPTVSAMWWRMASTPEGTLRLGSLPALVNCCLVWNYIQGHVLHLTKGHVLHLTPDSFSGATGLTDLKLFHHSRLQMAPRCLRGLSMLVKLRLVDCGLTAVPAELSDVRHTLRLLYISQNAELEISCVGFDTLLSLPKLEILDVNKRSAWSLESTQYLASFHWEWQKLRPGAPLPELKLK